MSNEVQTIERDDNAAQTVSDNQNMTPSQMLAMAVSKDLDVDKMEKLMALEKEWKADRAREAFYQALSDFQNNCPIVKANKQGHNNRYASLSQVVSAIKDPLKEAGLSYRFEQKHEDSLIVVTCIVSHIQGHTESMTMKSEADTSGGKNAIQSIASANSYLRRYTLIGGLGVITSDEDDDGASVKTESQPVKTISTDQVIELDDLIDEVNADKSAFLRVCKVEKLEDLPECKYKTAKAKLEAKRS